MKHIVLLLILYFSKTIAVDDNPKVIIVGSGPSGIAAACRLLVNGINNLIILEAEHRYGGRVSTTEIGEYQIDLGAEWVHGEVANVAYELASPLGLLSKSGYPGGPEIVEPDQRFYESSGYKVENLRMEKLLQFTEEVREELEADTTVKIGSVGDFVDSKFDSFFKEHPEYSVDFQKAYMSNLESVEMASDAAEDWHTLSFGAAEEYDNCGGHQAINWKEKTYGMILDILMKRYPNPDEELPVLNKTLLNKKVSKINYQGDGPVKITTKDGSEYDADHVIFTPSLGVLKADHEKIFDPPLSEEKREAIERLGFGKHGKIILYYDNPWWQWTRGTKAVINNILWTTEDRREIENDPEKKWMLSVTYVVPVEYKPKLLLFWLTGIHAKDMEQIPEELLKSQTFWFLQKFFGNSYNITSPREIRRTTWNTNPNFRGTYSYVTVEAFNSRRGNRDLEEPIMREEKPVLQFAGEATNPRRYATVNGAIESGWREADRLIELYKKKNMWKMIDDLLS